LHIKPWRLEKVELINAAPHRKMVGDHCPRPYYYMSKLILYNVVCFDVCFLLFVCFDV